MGKKFFKIFEAFFLQPSGPVFRAHVQCIRKGLKAYFRFYNTERMHQALGYQTPNIDYAAACGGGARIVNKVVKLEQRHSAA